MSALVDRLRGVLRPNASAGPSIDGGGTPSIDAAGEPSIDGGADLVRSARASLTRDARTPADASAVVGDDVIPESLGGEWRGAGAHRFLVVDRVYRPGHRHGRVAIADSLPPSTGLWPQLSLLAGRHCAPRALFIDLETTGLAGGAGTYAFLVGCAWFDGALFHVRQFLLSTVMAERALLEAVAETARSASTVVSYNGKSFDLPLIETRFLFHRMRTPFADMPHVDMVHPARRLWRESSQDPDERSGRSLDTGCRLSSLERTLCGHERDGDVPGFEIPARYFQFVRSGDPRPLEAVLEHNRLDLISLALVTARAAQLLDDGPTAATTAREALGLGRLYERAEMPALASASFARAAGLEGDMCADVLTRAEGLRAYALLARRQRRHGDAALAWQRLIELHRCPPPMVREAMEALAIHHEHRLRNPRSAHAFAMQALPLQSTTNRREALNHRLARLNRKLGADRQSAALF